MPGTLLVGIDVGTLSSKGVLVTPAGQVLAQHQVEHGLSIPRPGWAEHDADRVWWNDLCVVCRALLDQAQGVAAHDVAGIAVSALGADLVPLGAEGRPLRPAILYGIDARALHEVAELNQRYGADEIFRSSGTSLSAQSIGPKLLWLRHNEPEVYARTRMVCTASSYLVHRLCGAYVLDPTTAAFYDPLFDVHAQAWSDLCAADGIGTYIAGHIPLPELAWPAEVVGQVTPQAAAACGLRPGTPVTAGTIDVVSEALSVGVNAPGDMLAVYGTTACLYLILQTVVSHPALWTLPHGLPGRQSLVAGMATTGALTRWFRDEGLVMLPYFAGERTPLMDAQARGVIAGLTLAHGRGHLYRAILEATAYGLAHNTEVMAAAGAKPTRVVASGGGTQSDLWLQIVSDVTGWTQELPAQRIGACYGDAFWAGLATGQVDLADLNGAWVQIERRFHPDPAQHVLYQEYYRIYRDLYPHTVDDVHALAQLGSDT
jgi:xylulokinase